MGKEKDEPGRNTTGNNRSCPKINQCKKLKAIILKDITKEQRTLAIKETCSACADYCNPMIIEKNAKIFDDWLEITVSISQNKAKGQDDRMTVMAYYQQRLLRDAEHKFLGENPWTNVKRRTGEGNG